MSYLRELRRRSVFKVGVAYTIVAWLLVQIAVNVFPALQLQPWTVTFVTALLILGFPVALLLAWAYEVTPEGIKRTKDIPFADSVTSMTGRKLNYWITGLLAVAVGFVIVDQYVLEERAAAPNAEADVTTLAETAVQRPVRFIASPPRGVSVSGGTGLGMSSLALSPDGRTLVVAGTGGDTQRLYARPLGGIEATPIPGTDGGMAPFFSPNGAWIGFFADGVLKRVPAGGGTAVEIANVQGFPSGATWGPDDRIVFSGGCCSALHVVDAGGGEPPDLLTRLEGNEVAHSLPEMLPGGRALVFASGGWIHALDIARGRRFRLIEGTAPRYTASGYLLFARDRAVFAVPFDLEDLDVTGPAVPVVEGVDNSGADAFQFAISGNGTLAYVPAVEAHELLLVGPDGTERRVTAERPEFQNPRFSPDGRQVVVAATERTGDTIGDEDLWLLDLETGTEQRLTFDGGRAPVWTPDGTAVTFSHLGDEPGIYTKPVDGRGQGELVLGIERFHWLVGWHPDGRTLVFGQLGDAREGETARSSIVALTDGETDVIVEPGDIWGGRLSPNGEWLAYYDRASGRYDVYVTDFPDAETRYLIADADGQDPAWSPDGDEIYYESGGRLMAAELDMTSGIRVVSRRVVIEPFSPPRYDDYDIHQGDEGRALVLVRPVGDAQAREIVVVVDWFTELRERMP